MAGRFRHEDREAVPKGWKVRTVKAGAHRVRVAFPPGRKQKGSGRLVSVLHPIGENPCGLRSSNPAELMIMGANPPRHRNAYRYELVAVERHGSGEFRRHFETREEAKQFARDKMFSAAQGIYFKPHVRKVRKEAEAASPNPRVEVVHGDNPPVEEIVEQFTGTPAGWLDIYNEPHMKRGRYGQLGKLIALYVKPVAGGQVRRIGAPESRQVKFEDYWGGDPPMVVTDSTAKQIYFVAGNQDLTECLEAFGGNARGDGLVVLGQGRRIDYEGRKEHVADPDEDQWKHEHGEENGVLPTVLFDTKNKRLLYEGGDYRIEGAWIRN
jgi:hypothetical protein